MITDISRTSSEGDDVTLLCSFEYSIKPKIWLFKCG
jgi:hypothetical protein